MKIFDISQELFSSKVFPGDTAPSYQAKLRISEGDECNLSNITLCAHNSTHMDAPYHFYNDGKTIYELDLNKCVGECQVVEWDGELTGDDVRKIVKPNIRKVLIKGDITLSLSAAVVLNELKTELVGVEGYTVGPIEAPKEVHLELLGREVIILEGLNLKEVPIGEYFLVAVPIKIGGLDGAPCRPILMEKQF